MQINITKNKININKGHTVNEGEYNIRQCDFNFSKDYTDDLVKIAVFTKDGKSYKVTITEDSCMIPIEVLEKKGIITIGVYAYSVIQKNGEEILEKRFSPAPAKIFMDYGSYVKNAENSSTPTPTEMEQIEEIVINVNTKMDNLDIEAEKEDKITTITITKKDGTKETHEILDGIDGYTPIKGTDYWTNQDKEEIIADVNLILKPELDKKQNTLIAGSNITIENDVISATGGGPIATEIDPTVPSYVKNITQQDITNWNNKSDFSGNYNDLSNKPTIPVVPTNISAFNNDVGYLTQHQDITGKEDKTNKVTSISSSSTDTQYPTAKCVYDLIGNIESLLAEV